MKMEDAAKVIRKPNRVEELDIIKGIAIVLMLIGHCDAGMERPKSVAFIYLFHMAVFFMASGYVFQGEKLKTAKDFYNYCRKKVTGLYVPYVIWAVIFTLLHNVFIRINVYTNDVRLMELVSSRFNAMTPYWSWKEQLYNCKLALLAKANTRMGGGCGFSQPCFL